MKAILIGLTFVLLDFQIVSEHFIIDVLPDFIGYIILTWGLVREEDKVSHFSGIHMFTKGMATYTLIASCNFPTFWMNILFSAGSTAGSLYVAFQIVEGLRQVEEAKGWHLAVESLTKRWKLLLFSSILVCVVCMSRVLSMGALVIYTIGVLGFLMSFYETKRLYEAKQYESTRE